MAIPAVPLPVPKPPEEKIKIIIEKEPIYLKNGIGRVPPSAVPLEEAILGALLVDTTAAEILPILEPEMFFKPAHIHIIGAMKKLYSEQIGLDLLTVSDQLRKHNHLNIVGGEYYLIQLTQKVGSGAHIDFHARIVMQKYVLRSLIDMSNKTIEKAIDTDPDIFNLMDKWDYELKRIQNLADRGKKIVARLNPMEELVEKIRIKKLGLTIGIPTGVSEFDNFASGFRKRELVTIAARPGMGKTSMIISFMVYGAIEKNHKIVFYSLEMSKNDVTNRIVARLTGIAFKKINSGDISEEQLPMVAAAFQRVDDSPLEIIDTSEHKNDFYKIVPSIREHIADGYEQVFLDYVQLVKLGPGKGGDRTSELNIITREFKALANELDFPMIELAQLSREPDKRPGHRPILADLKQSGSLEEDSDTVIFLLRDAYYEKKDAVRNIPISPMQADPEFVTLMIVAKGRSIGVGDFNCYCDFNEFKFISYSDTGF